MKVDTKEKTVAEVKPTAEKTEEVKSTEESKEADNTKDEEKAEVKEADDKKDEAKNESESTEKTTEAEKAEQLVLFTEKYEVSPSKRYQTHVGCYVCLATVNETSNDTESRVNLFGELEDTYLGSWLISVQCVISDIWSLIEC